MENRSEKTKDKVRESERNLSAEVVDDAGIKRDKKEREKKRHTETTKRVFTPKNSS